MIYLRPRSRRASISWPDSLRIERHFLCFVAIPFLLGLLFGSVFGSYALHSFPFPRLSDCFFPHHYEVSRSVFLFRSFFYLVSSLLFSTSFLGILFFPLLSFLRGVTLAYSVAFLFSSMRFPGLLTALFAVGIPSFPGLISYFLVAYEGVSLSMRLLPAHQSPGDSLLRQSSISSLFFAFLLSLFELLYSWYLLPKLLQQMLFVLSV